MLKQFFKNILSLNFILPFKKGNRFIFIYHDISTKSSSHYSKHYSTKPEDFKRQLDFYKKNFELISIEEIVSSDLENTKNYASIVFDDGFKSVIDVAAPILDHYKIPFAVFVNKYAIQKDRLWLSDLELENKQLIHVLTNELNLNSEDIINNLKTNPTFNNQIQKFMNTSELLKQGSVYMDENEIKLLHQRGVIIGSHTVNHPVLACCSKEMQKTEIIENKEYIDKLLNQDTIHFAFPFGKKEHFNDETIKILKEQGHLYNYTSNPISFNSSTIKTGFIPRIGVLNDSDKELMFYINRQFFKKIQL